MLNLAAFEHINKKHKLKPRVAPVVVVKIKPSVKKEIWGIEPKDRKALADSLINESIKLLGLFTAADLAEATGLSISCARDKLNELWARKKVTRNKIDNDLPGRGVFHFELVA